ncbi:hypothetical protein M0802_008874 [Mischocyttarus mexicanus]|nr:hypothetical protein M0802_008874 [Mischocyttarus mexicanus]
MQTALRLTSQRSLNNDNDDDDDDDEEDSPLLYFDYVECARNVTVGYRRRSLYKPPPPTPPPPPPPLPHPPVPSYPLKQ